MRYDPDKHHRRSRRLEGYDYSRAGVYFITLCVQQRDCLFGDVVDGAMLLNGAGCMIDRWWEELLAKFPSLVLDESVVMPNHMHGILVLRGRECEATNPPLGDIMQWFKMMTTNEYIRSVRSLGWRRFQGKLWQRNYFDLIIQSQEDLEATRVYIRQNPARWAWDEENPTVARDREGKIDQQGGHIGPPLQNGRSNL